MGSPGIHQPPLWSFVCPWEDGRRRFESASHSALSVLSGVQQIMGVRGIVSILSMYLPTTFLLPWWVAIIPGKLFFPLNQPVASQCSRKPPPVDDSWHREWNLSVTLAPAPGGADQVIFVFTTQYIVVFNEWRAKWTNAYGNSNTLHLPWVLLWLRLKRVVLIKAEYLLWTQGLARRNREK